MLRDRFPILSRVAYLNSCSRGALSVDVREAYERYLGDWDEHGSPWELWVAKADEARAAFAELVGAEPEDVAVTTSLSAAVSALASGLRFDTGRPKVVLSEVEFPTSVRSDTRRRRAERTSCTRPTSRRRSTT